MERLTGRSPKNSMAYLVKVKPNEQDVESRYPNTLKCIMDAFEKLAKYEETGLEPKQIYNLMKVEKLEAYDIPVPEGYIAISKVFCIDKIKQLGIEVELVTGIYVGNGEMVITGIPDENDETHNCDEMGCSSLSHVLYRQRL